MNHKTKAIPVRIWKTLLLIYILVIASGTDINAEEVTGYRDVEDGIRAEAITTAQENAIDAVGAEEIPETYNPLMSAGIMQTVRNQGNGNTCWSFASIALAEASLQKKGISFDGSELHLAYFTYNHGNDPLGNTAEDSLSLTSASTNTSWNYISQGGNMIFSQYVLSGWTGAAEETLAPYSQTCNKSTNMPLDSELEYEDTAHLQNVRMIKITSNPEIAKAYIMKWGGIATSYRHYESYLNKKTSAYYYPTSTKVTNHAVTIVGWDDTYAKENFLTAPTADGAWLVRGSYGTEYGTNGYYWLSYEDQGLAASDQAYAFDFEKADNYDANYQYDGAPLTKKVTYTTPIDTWSMANIFTASVDRKEAIGAVGFWTSAESLYYSAYIYTNVSSGSPESGVLAAAVFGTTDCTGYYTVPLTQAITLAGGQKFSVVVKFTTLDGSNASIPLEGSGSGTWYSVAAAIEAGQSFYRGGTESWNDCVDLSAKGYGNARVKAYTSNVETGAEPGGVTDPETSTETEKPTETETETEASTETEKPAETETSTETEKPTETETETSTETEKPTETETETPTETEKSTETEMETPTETEKPTETETEAATEKQIPQSTETEHVTESETASERAEYHITYKLNGGTNSIENQSRLSEDEVLKLSSPVRKKYTFSGWYLNQKKVTKIQNLTENITLTAKWTKVTVKKAVCTKLKKSGQRFKISVKKISGAKGYEIQYGTKKNFKSAKKYTTAKLTATSPKLKNGRFYYVRIRAYKTDSTGTKIYGAYSSIKKIVIK